MSNGVGILFRVRHLLCRRSLINVYYYFVYSYVIYCIEEWGSVYQSYLHPLLSTQKRLSDFKLLLPECRSNWRNVYTNMMFILTEVGVETYFVYHRAQLILSMSVYETF